MLTRDLRYALRSLSRSPGFALTVVVTLGLGIGANTAIFSVVRGVLLRPLPHRDGDRLMYLRQSVNGAGGESILFSVPEILDFRTGAPSLGGIAEYSQMNFTMQGAGDPVRIKVGLVTGNFFQVMGLSPVAGRLLNGGDDGTGVPPVMVLTHEYWVRQFGRDPGVVGKTVRVDDKPVTIVGVVEPAPSFPYRMDAILNLVISEHHSSAMMVHGRTHRMTEVIARLAPGASVAQARAEVAAVRARVQKDHPDAYDAASGYRVALIPFREVLGEQARLTLWLLMGAAAFVMVIASANVINLTLMRGVRRDHEMVLRSALGAGAGRLRGLLLAENLLLAVAGAILGLVFARVGLHLLISFAERYSPRANEIRLDGVVLGFALLLTLVVALILSFAPRLSREGMLRRGTGSVGRQRLQRGLVVAQLAVSVVLLSGAGLLVRTLQRLSRVDSGLDGRGVLTMQVSLDRTGRGEADTKGLYERMRLEIGAIPGVSDVGLGSTMPLRAQDIQLDIRAEGRTLAAGEAMPRAEYRTADPAYFRASGIPLIEGREFAATDRAGGALVVILNQTLAKRLFPDRDPIGQRVAWTGDVLRFIPISGEWRTIVGVVGDTKDGGLDAAPRGVVFHPLDQDPGMMATGLVIRTAGEAPALVPAATRVVRAVAPGGPIEKVLTVDQIRDESVAPRRLNAALVTLFGALAVTIAAVGIAGVLAFSVTARTNEIGIRMSLGADSHAVQRMVLMEGGVLLAGGLVLGVFGALLATRLIQGLLFGVAPDDPATLVAVIALMAGIGIAACWLPALRAARIDPAVAIRSS